MDRDGQEVLGPLSPKEELSLGQTLRETDLTN